jgi:site-specific DNA recombinase
MTEHDLPVYDAMEHGIAADIHTRPADHPARIARANRYKGGIGALAQRLNNDRTIDGVFRPETPVLDNANAVIYLRVSSEEQAKKGGTAEGYSIPYQRDACHAKAASMGLVVVEEYVDAGQSAKSARRPRLQAMLRELEAKQVRYVIVHKIDRLARNKRDDFLINEAIAEAGACLVSVVDLVDDTPQGKFNYTIQAGLAQLYVDNLAVEVMKGMNKKADAGGTPYRAPIGYLNKRRIEGVADIRWVEIDPDRGPLVTWAFHEYATGDWSLSRLRDVLTDKGLTTRPTPKRAAKPLSLNGLHKILTNPYYAGLLPWQGAYYEGAHEPLIDVDTWLRVQDVLHAHNTSGEKHRVHHHYLKGSIFCSTCGSRFIFSRNKGRGGTYDYFLCNGRRFKNPRCTRRALPVSTVEAGVEAFYDRFEISPERVQGIRHAIHTELGTQREQAELDSARATKRLHEARDQRQKLMEAHYTGAIPRDLLKTEMDRLTREIASAEREQQHTRTSVTDLETQLERALAVAGNCATYYDEATPAIRRLMNQGFFTKLYINDDGEVAGADLTEPFAQVLSRAPQDTVQHAVQVAAEVSQDQDTTKGTNGTQRAVQVSVTHQAGASRSNLVLTCTIRQADLETNQGRLAPALGLNFHSLVGPGGVEPPLAGT